MSINRPRLSSVVSAKPQNDAAFLEGVDSTMLDFILDLFIKYLAQGLVNEGNNI